MSSAYDYIWKVIVGGQGGVGKTTILYRFIHNEFLEDTKLTVGVQFHTQALERQDRKISLVLWDLGGQERFRFIQPEYVKGAVGCFVCFDMSRFMTLESTREWIDMFRQSAPNAPIVIVGTKLDLIDEKEQQNVMNAANQLVAETGCLAFIPTSSKLGINVNETVYYMVDTLLYYAYYGLQGATAQQ
nr:Rab family GTPase [Candidatus Sigynarchaeum springense]MDO8116040.1 Rab family GTPase [Candidatus Sigynarchaeota archaeon]